MVFVNVNISLHDHMETIRELLMHTNLSFYGIRKSNNKLRLTLKNDASKIVFVYKELIRIQKESSPPTSMYT